MTTKTKRGGYRKTDFGDLIKTDPEQAAKVLREAWALAGGATGAARNLDISRGSFFRCARLLESMGYDVGRPSGTRTAGIDTVRS